MTFASTSTLGTDLKVLFDGAYTGTSSVGGTVTDSVSGNTLSLRGSPANVTAVSAPGGGAAYSMVSGNGLGGAIASFPTGGYKLEFCNFKTTGASQSFIVTYNSGDTLEADTSTNGSGQISSFRYVSGSSYTTASSASFADGAWHTLITEYSVGTNTITVYVDGVSVISATGGISSDPLITSSLIIQANSSLPMVVGQLGYAQNASTSFASKIAAVHSTLVSYTAHPEPGLPTGWSAVLAVTPDRTRRLSGLASYAQQATADVGYFKALPVPYGPYSILGSGRVKFVFDKYFSNPSGNQALWYNTLSDGTADSTNVLVSPVSSQIPTVGSTPGGTAAPVFDAGGKHLLWGSGQHATSIASGGYRLTFGVFKANSVTNGLNNTIYGTYNSSPYMLFWLSTGAGGLEYYSHGNTGINGGANYHDDTWHRFILYQNVSGTFQLYIDGSQVANTGLAMDNPFNDTQFCVGDLLGGIGSYTFSGTIGCLGVAQDPSVDFTSTDISNLDTYLQTYTTRPEPVYPINFSAVRAETPDRTRSLKYPTHEQMAAPFEPRPVPVPTDPFHSVFSRLVALYLNTFNSSTGAWTDIIGGNVLTKQTGTTAIGSSSAGALEILFDGSTYYGSHATSGANPLSGYRVQFGNFLTTDSGTTTRGLWGAYYAPYYAYTRYLLLDMANNFGYGVGKLIFESQYSGNGQGIVASTVAVNDGRYHRYIVYEDLVGNTVSLYLDGVLQGTVNYPTQDPFWNSGSSGWYFGYAGQYSFFNGQQGVMGFAASGAPFTTADFNAIDAEILSRTVAPPPIRSDFTIAPDLTRSLKFPVSEQLAFVEPRRYPLERDTGISYGGSNTTLNPYGSSVATLTVTIPTSTQPGDLLVFDATLECYSNLAVSSFPSGWTQLTTASATDSGTSYITYKYIFSRLAQVGDAGSTVSIAFSGYSSSYFSSLGTVYRFIRTASTSSTVYGWNIVASSASVANTTYTAGVSYAVNASQTLGVQAGDWAITNFATGGSSATVRESVQNTAVGVSGAVALASSSLMDGSFQGLVASGSDLAATLQFKFQGDGNSFPIIATFVRIRQTAQTIPYLSVSPETTRALKFPNYEQLSVPFEPRFGTVPINPFASIYTRLLALYLNTYTANTWYDVLRSTPLPLYSGTGASTTSSAGALEVVFDGSTYYRGSPIGTTFSQGNYTLIFGNFVVANRDVGTTRVLWGSQTSGYPSLVYDGANAYGYGAGKLVYSNNGITVASLTTVNDNSFHSYALQTTASSTPYVTLYVDGVLCGTTNGSIYQDQGWTTTSWVLGANPNYGYSYFLGQQGVLGFAGSSVPFTSTEMIAVSSEIQFRTVLPAPTVGDHTIAPDITRSLKFPVFEQMAAPFYGQLTTWPVKPFSVIWNRMNALYLSNFSGSTWYDETTSGGTLALQTGSAATTTAPAGAKEIIFDGSTYYGTHPAGGAGSGYGLYRLQFGSFQTTNIDSVTRWLWGSYSPLRGLVIDGNNSFGQGANSLVLIVNGSYIKAFVPYSNGAYHRYVVYEDPTGITYFYVDGTLQGSVATYQTDPAWNSGTPYFLGANPNYGYSDFIGQQGVMGFASSASPFGPSEISAVDAEILARTTLPPPIRSDFTIAPDITRTRVFPVNEQLAFVEPRRFRLENDTGIGYAGSTTGFITYGTGQTVLTVTVASNVQAGDLLIFDVSLGSYSSSSYSNPPTGWTLQTSISLGGNYPSFRLIFSKIASAADAGTSVSITVNAGYSTTYNSARGFIYRFTKPADSPTQIYSWTVSATNGVNNTATTYATNTPYSLGASGVLTLQPGDWLVSNYSTGVYDLSNREALAGLSNSISSGGAISFAGSSPMDSSLESLVASGTTSGGVPSFNFLGNGDNFIISATFTRIRLVAQNTPYLAVAPEAADSIVIPARTKKYPTHLQQFTADPTYGWFFELTAGSFGLGTRLKMFFETNYNATSGTWTDTTGAYTFTTTGTKPTATILPDGRTVAPTFVSDNRHLAGSTLYTFPSGGYRLQFGVFKINGPSASANLETLWSNYQGSNPYVELVYDGGNYLGLGTGILAYGYTNSGGSSYFAYSNASVNDSKWHRYMIVEDTVANTATLYIDGVAQTHSTSGYTVPAAPWTTSTWIGDQNNSPGTLAFNGSLGAMGFTYAGGAYTSSELAQVDNVLYLYTILFALADTYGMRGFF